MAYFSQSKGESDKKEGSIRSSGEPRIDQVAPAGKYAAETNSVLGSDMLVTGNILSAGSVQVMGRVVGDIHAAKLTIGEGAHVAGNIIAQELTVHGTFRGTVNANSVKLQSTAVVDGEILNRSLTIEQHAQFEGVSRRLEKPVEAPTNEQIKGEKPTSASMAEVVPFSGSFS